MVGVMLGWPEDIQDHAIVRHKYAPCPAGCRWCGYTRSEHKQRRSGRLWAASQSWHVFAEPTPAQIRARFDARARWGIADSALRRHAEGDGVVRARDSNGVRRIELYWSPAAQRWEGTVGIGTCTERPWSGPQHEAERLLQLWE